MLRHADADTLRVSVSGEGTSARAFAGAPYTHAGKTGTAQVYSLKGEKYTPEPWTAADSLAWLKAMAWDLRGNMDEEIARTRLSVDRTPEQVDELEIRR